jgi:hypothetical protein
LREPDTRRIDTAELNRLRSACVSGPLDGKRVIFVVASEQKGSLDPSNTFRKHDVSPTSGMMDYADFFLEGHKIAADVLILMNPDSVYFWESPSLAKAALAGFRGKNRDSAVILDASVIEDIGSVHTLWDSGLVNIVVRKPENAGFENLMELGADVLGLLRE